MTRARSLIAALALTLTAAVAAAQTETQAPESQSSSQSSAQSASKSDKPVHQGEKASHTDHGRDVHTSPPTTPRRQAPQIPANGADVDRGARGTGVATGFVAAGIGLAILGLFVRKRGRHEDDEDDSRGSGTYTRM